MTSFTFSQQNEVHLWSFQLEVENEVYSELIELLNAEEKLRANSYKLKVVRDRFVIGRATLRMILGKYLGAAANQVPISYGSNGRPELSDLSLNFNLTHSNRLAALAVSQVPVLGVDIEEIRFVEAADRIVKTHFSDEEAREYFSLEPASREVAFLRAFTRKEAALKAYGIGLAVPMRCINVGFLPGRLQTSIPGHSPLCIQEFIPEHGFVGSIAGPNSMQVAEFKWFHRSSN